MTSNLENDIRFICRKWCSLRWAELNYNQHVAKPDTQVFNIEEVDPTCAFGKEVIKSRQHWSNAVLNYGGARFFQQAKVYNRDGSYNAERSYDVDRTIFKLGTICLLDKVGMISRSEVIHKTFPQEFYKNGDCLL